MTRYIVIITIIMLMGLVGTPIFAFVPPQKLPIINCLNPNEGGKIEYFLPNPGMLLNHKMYFVKEMRDRILEALIRDKAKRIEFHILQSDKFLAMTDRFFERKETWNQIQEALGRSSNASEVAFMDLVNVKNSGMAIPAHLKDALTSSTRKHLEIVGEMRCHTTLESLIRLFDDDTGNMKVLLLRIRNLN